MVSSGGGSRNMQEKYAPQAASAWMLKLSPYDGNGKEDFHVNCSLVCFRPSVSGAVRRAPVDQGKNEGSLGRDDARGFSRSLAMTRLQLRSPLFSFVTANREPGTG